MLIQRLEISRRNSWETNPDELTGTIQFRDSKSSISLILDEDACQQILNICAESLVRVSKSVARDLTTNSILQIECEAANG